MRIVIDLQGAQTESRFRGIGRYSLSLAKAMAKIRGEHEVIIALSGLFADTIEPIKAEFSSILPLNNICVWQAVAPVMECNINNEWRRNSAEIAREAFLASLEPDVILITSLFEGFIDDGVTSIGKLSSIPTAVILYDLIPYIYQELYLPTEALQKYYFNKIKSFKNANLFLGISQSSCDEAFECLRINQEQTINILSAVDESFESSLPTNKEIKDVKNKYRIKDKFVMYAPGGFDYRKNFENLIKAYASLEKELRRDLQLVIVSKVPIEDAKRLKDMAFKSAFEPNELVITGYVPEKDLIALYKSSYLFVFASKHEGFGLPVLEAMSCGAPVIGSNATSIPEVIGNSEALFDPNSIDDIKNKIEQALRDDSFRQELKQKAAIQVKNFSWDESAKKVIAALESLRANRAQPINDYQLTQNIIQKIAALPLANTSDEDIAKLAVCIDKNLKSAKKVKRRKEKLTWKIEGPFDSSYSLALLNRESARALTALGHNVILHSTEGPGDFTPNEDFLAVNHDIRELYLKNNVYDVCNIDCVSRNLYPPRVSDMSSSFNMLHHYAWEESGFPAEWANNFNKYLDGLTCLSTHVKKILIDAGVYAPMLTSGCGVDHWGEIKPAKTSDLNAKSFRFLHVSSCFPRKGADLLLEAYGMAFSSSDDVSLIIKTFKNPHNNVHKLLGENQKNNANFPHVVIIYGDISDGELKALYEQCHVLVAPSKAEGFGLPMAEAMLSGLPAITTGWGGQLDFCDKENSWLVDYDFEYAKTHFELFGSVWAKIKTKNLARALKEAFNTPPNELKQKALLGRNKLLANFKWNNIASRLVSAYEEFSSNDYDAMPKIAWISTWNTKCGIATYSKHLIDNMQDNITIFAPTNQAQLEPDAKNVVRCWDIGKEGNNFSEVETRLSECKINVVVIQFNYGFFNHNELSNFIKNVYANGYIVVMVMHATQDPANQTPIWNFALSHIIDALALCDRILVHAPIDLNRLKNIGLTSNVSLFPHSVLSGALSVQAKNDVPIIATYGFCLPHKGLIETIKALAILKQEGVNVKLRMVNAQYPAPESQALLREIKALILELAISELVETHNDFLSDEESLALLSSADLTVFAYQETGESSSAAVRYGMATKKCVAVTPLSIFDNLGDAVFRFNATSPKAIAQGIKEALGHIAKNSEEYQKINRSANRWLIAHDCKAVGVRLGNICRSLIYNRLLAK